MRYKRQAGFASYLVFKLVKKLFEILTLYDFQHCLNRPIIIHKSHLLNTKIHLSNAKPQFRCTSKLLNCNKGGNGNATFMRSSNIKY